MRFLCGWSLLSSGSREELPETPCLFLLFRQVFSELRQLSLWNRTPPELLKLDKGADCIQDDIQKTVEELECDSHVAEQ